MSKSVERQNNLSSHRIAVRIGWFAVAAAVLFLLHLAARWAVWQQIVPLSALDVTTTFVFHWYTVAVAWGVWREGVSWRRAVGVASWVSLGLALWIAAGLYNGERFRLEMGTAIARYCVIHWSIYLATAAGCLMLVRTFWGIRIVSMPSSVRPSDGGETRSAPGRDRVWSPTVTIRGLMLLTAAIAVAAAFLRYAPASLYRSFDGNISPWVAAELCIDPIISSFRGMMLLTFAALMCSYARRSLPALAAGVAIAFGLAVTAEYGSLALKREYAEYVLYRAIYDPGIGYLDVTTTASLFDTIRVDVASGIASTLVAFAAVLALPSLGYRIVTGRR